MARSRNRPTLEFFWAEPDAEIVEQKLLGLSYELEDFRAPLAAAAEISRQNVETRFKTGTDPSGRAWDEWAESYEPWALTHTTGRVFGDRANLHLTGRLERGITSQSAWRVTGSSVFLDTSGLPEYWAWNNFGATRTTSKAAPTKAAIASQARSILGEAAKKGRKMSARAAVSQAQRELSGQNVLPERAFVGLSTPARAKIEVAFAGWFTGEVQSVQRGGTSFFRTQPRRGRTFL